MSNPNPKEDGAVKLIAQKGFEKNIDFYENARPSYPLEAISILETVLELIPGESHVIDLGAGTGKFTRLLLNGNYHLTAIEPSAAMRDKFSQILPTVPILDGNSWNIPIPSESQDAVVCAQAFHWFANLNTLKEVHRVLKSGGRFGMIWNSQDREKKKWVGEMIDYKEQYEMNSPQYRLGLWKKVWEEEEAKCLFSPLQFQSIQHSVQTTKELIRQRVLSSSYIACQEQKVQQEISQKIVDILEANANEIEYDKNGLVTFPYSTDIFWCKKK